MSRITRFFGGRRVAAGITGDTGETVVNKVGEPVDEAAQIPPEIVAAICAAIASVSEDEGTVYVIRNIYREGVWNTAAKMARA